MARSGTLMLVERGGRLLKQWTFARPRTGFQIPHAISGLSFAAASRSFVRLLLQLMPNAIARQHLRDARFGSRALAARGEELAVLELDAVHQDVDVADVRLCWLCRRSGRRGARCRCRCRRCSGKELPSGPLLLSDSVQRADRAEGVCGNDPEALRGAGQRRTGHACPGRES